MGIKNLIVIPIYNFSCQSVLILGRVHTAIISSYLYTFYLSLFFTITNMDIIVDIQGFKDVEESFFPQKVAIVSINNVYYAHWIIA